MDKGRIVACGEPSCLITYPPSPRAATLLGIETILPGRVVRRDGEHAVVALQPAGPSVRARTTRLAAVGFAEAVTITLPAGAVHVLRPEAECAPERNVLSGTVSAVSSLSSGTRLVVETPAPIVGLVPWHVPDRRWAVGEPAVVAFSPESVHVIPERIQPPDPLS
jgi:molybdate transport system ATP-binding protein